MSYILDALERSERERQQQDAPSFRQDQALLHMGQQKRSPWLVGLVLVLLLNVLVLSFLLLSPEQMPETPLAEQMPLAVQKPLTQQVPLAQQDQLAQAELVPVRETLPTKKRAATAQINNSAGAVYQTDSDVKRETGARVSAGQYEASQNSASVVASVELTIPAEKAVTNNQLERTAHASEGELITPKVRTPAFSDSDSDSGLGTGLAATLESNTDTEYDKELGLRIDPSYASIDKASRVPGEQSLSSRPRVSVDDAPGSAVALASSYSDVAFLHELNPSSRPHVPKLVFNSHIYSSEPTARRVMINNIYLREGERFEGMMLLGIDENFVVFEKNGQQFKIAAMRDWLG